MQPALAIKILPESVVSACIGDLMHHVCSTPTSPSSHTLHTAYTDSVRWGRFTPLHRACWGAEKRHTDTVAVLLEAGVPFDQRAADGSLPIDMARNNAATRKLLKRWARRSRAESKPVA